MRGGVLARELFASSIQLYAVYSSVSYYAYYFLYSSYTSISLPSHPPSPSCLSPSFPPSIIEGCNPLEYITIEYQLDSLLHKLSTLKPVLAICDGIVMGGGAGIFQGAGLRVVTPSSTFAMPECRIALLPDAGAMGFLFRAPGEVPLYCALTGARLGGECIKAVGLATHVVDGGDVHELLRVVRTQDVGKGWGEVLAGFEEKRKRRSGVTPVSVGFGEREGWWMGWLVGWGFVDV